MNTAEGKIKEAQKELKEWLDNPLSIQDHTTYGINKIESKLTESKIPKSTLNAFEALDNWYSNNFVYDLLTKEESDFRVDLTSNGYHHIVIADKLAHQYPNNPPSLKFDKIAYSLANCIIQQWYDEARELLRIINEGLNSKLLSGGLDYKMTSWFILEVANIGFEMPETFGKRNYPEDMIVYQRALDHWNTDDLALIDEIVTDLCDFHLEEASYGNLSDSAGKKDPMFLQFSSAKWFVYAFEVLSWLSVRKMKNLQNPDKFSHPLMQIALNQLPTNPNPRPENELFNRVLQKL